MIKGLSERQLMNRILLFEFSLLVLFLLNVATLRGVEAVTDWFEAFVVLSSVFGLFAVLTFLWRSNFLKVSGGKKNE